MKKENISYQVKVILRGLVRTVWGTATAAAIGGAIYIFIGIPNEGGYVAVCDFIVAVCCLVSAFLNVYAQGVYSFRKARKCAKR